MFLDIGTGILVSIFASWFYGIELNFLMIIVAILFSLGPDLDFLYHFTKRGDTKYDYKHRELMHYPLIYLPVGSILFYAFFGEVWAVVFFLASLLHFIHDSIAIGWGIKWLYPFSRNNYAFFYVYSKHLKYGLRKFVLVFDEKKLPSIVEKHGDTDWVKNIYYKWHPIAIVEFTIFVLSLIILYLYINF